MFPNLENTYSQLPEQCFALQQPQQPDSPGLLIFNDELAGMMGLSPEGLSDEQLAAMLSGKSLPTDSRPLAMAYAGHQFGNFVPQLGDGRALLIGEVLTPGGERKDIQLKGSGRTPFSRGGDGLAAIGPVLREYLVSEAMATLGVPTTRALAAVATGLPVLRETGRERGAVLTRVAASHIRVGTFQFFAARGDEQALRALTRYTIERHVPTLKDADNPALALLSHVINAQATLVAAWMSLGFVHGVMNTDNCTLSGETIDYGPCAFMDTYNPASVFSSIDQQGRYAYANQPGIAQWNIARLAETLLPLLDDDQDRAIALATAEVDRYPDIFQRHWRNAMGAKLGFATPTEEDDQQIQDLLALMHKGALDFTHTFRMLADCVSPENDSSTPSAAPAEDAPAWSAWLTSWRERLSRESEHSLEQLRTRLNGTNPAVIPRNNEVEDALTAVRRDGDMAPFLRLHRALQKPYESNEANAWLRQLPDPNLPHYRTFCGT